MKKILLTLGLLAITILPVFAANWVVINPDEALYVDTTSVSKYNQIYGRNNVYSIWIKNLNNNSHYDLTFTTSFNYTMSMFLIDCNTKEHTLKTGFFYDLNNTPITHMSFTSNDYQLQWQPIIPGSIGEDMYNYACGGYR